MNIEAVTELRKRRLRAFEISMDPGLITMPKDQLRELSHLTLQSKIDCGPFDPAFEHLTRMWMNYEKILFLRDLIDYGTSRELEAVLSPYLPRLGSEILGLNSEQCLNKAIEEENLAASTGDRPNLASYHRLRHQDYLKLASDLERFEAPKEVPKRAW